MSTISWVSVTRAVATKMPGRISAQVEGSGSVPLVTLPLGFGVLLLLMNHVLSNRLLKAVGNLRLPCLSIAHLISLVTEGRSVSCIE